MDQKKIVPKRRFAGFTGAWDKRKLGNHAEIITGGTPKTEIKEYWEPKEIPWMSSGEVNKKRLFDTDNKISRAGFENSSAKWVKEKSVLIGLAGQGKTRGTVAITEIPLTTNQSIAAIEPDKTLDSEFVFQNLEKRYEELRLISSGDGTRGGLNKKIVSEIEIIVPEIEEQKKIGHFFKLLDETITLYQRKLEKIKALKSAYLAEMFPAEGERVPKRRFKEFQDGPAWEERKLGDEVEFFSGLTYSPKNIVKNNGVLVLRSSNIKNGEIVDADNVYVDRSVVNVEKVRIGDIIVVVRNGSRDLIGKHSVVKKELKDTVIGAFMTGIRSKQYDFVNALLDTERFKLEISKSLGATINQITLGAFKNMIFKFPTIEEQIKIGAFFRNIDEMIVNQQRKLDKLKAMKQAYLHEMFV